jgi:hypothetical protein
LTAQQLLQPANKAALTQVTYCNPCCAASPSFIQQQQLCKLVILRLAGVCHGHASVCCWRGQLL